MAKLRVAIIGCGRRGDSDLRTGAGISQNHALAYRAQKGVRMVAFCDLIATRAEAFRDEHGNGRQRIYTDYRQMLRKEKPDLVSICTWPNSHAAIVCGCAAAGVRAIHCEKPMAVTWGQAKQMAAACEAAGVQLTFNHQRRFGATFRQVRELVATKAVGELLRIEAYTGNLFDWGTHWFDMMFFFNGDAPAEWVLGQIDLSTSRSVFGAPLEDLGLAMVKFANGVFGLMCTGRDAPHEVEFRLIGTEGMIELGRPEGVGLRVLSQNRAGWEVLDKAPKLHGQDFFVTAFADVIDALESQRQPELAARKALQATEVIFATYESSRRGGRVNLPLDADDSALAALIAAGGRR